ncbi:hypothetical protein ONS96_004470 [Cadophora gregata f. sp. sojae]|nr:hypothetical protein ONS96_004470 [Cadophora gregata f. sp. sojae]
MSEAAREEIVIMGITLFSCMMWRMNNFFSLFGMIAKPAKVEDYIPVEGKETPKDVDYASDDGARISGEKEKVESRAEPVIH